MSSTTQASPSGEKPQGKASRHTPTQQWTAVLGLLLGALLLCFLYCRHMISGLIQPDAMDFAQCGRNLLQGHGFVTQILHPLALSKSADPLHQPDMTHGILYPFVLALGFGMFGAKDAVVIGVSGLFYALTAPLIFLLGRRLFDTRVGWIAALVYLTNGTILEYAASGTHITLFLFLGTCLFYALYIMAVGVKQPAKEGGEESTALPRLPSLLAGFLAGLLYLTDPTFLWMIPVLVWAVARMSPRRPLAALSWFGLPMLLLILPAMLRFAQLTGNPLFGLRGSELWMGTEAHPGLLGYRMSAERFGIERATGLALGRKLILAAVDMIALLPQMPGSWILLFIAPSLVYQYSNASATRLRSTLLWSLVALAFGGLFFSAFPMRLMIVFPTLLIFAVAFLLHTLDAAKLKSEKVWAVSIGMGMLLLAPLVGNLIKTRYPASTPEANFIRPLARQIPATDVTFSDQPWLMAWYGEHASIWLPSDDLILTDLRNQFPAARWIVATRTTPGISPEWDETYRGLLGWARNYSRALAANASPPPAFQIHGSTIPLLKALEGFNTVPPEAGNDLPTVVILHAPASEPQPKTP